MKDRRGRQIDYMRVSITDRCDLRCKYCMPNDAPDIAHPEILRYEEFLKICQAAVNCGVTNFKVTGGEPLVRKGALEFIKNLKALPGAYSVTLTTNGAQLCRYLTELKDIGIDGINVSLDALDPALYTSITGRGDVSYVLNSIKDALALKIPLKINTVLLDENVSEWLKIAAIAESSPISVRFIELMPIGHATSKRGPNADNLLDFLSQKYGTPTKTDERLGNGPATYYDFKDMTGKIGVIAAKTHKFCDSCNRVRLTADGVLKTCLCYDTGIDIKTPLRAGADEKELADIIADAIQSKADEHCFNDNDGNVEPRHMNRIGG